MNFNDDSPHSPFPFKDNVAAGEERKKGGNLAEISLRDFGLARTQDARPMIYPIFGTVSPKNNSSANGIFSFLRENLEKRKRFRRKLLKLHNVFSSFGLSVWKYVGERERWFYISFLNILHTMV